MMRQTKQLTMPCHFFFLVAKAPTGYVIVGVFIVQFETAECIAEALELFRQWCPDFSPKFWMVDFSNAEINAISSVFPESRVALCDFHREQAWERWCRKRENGVADKDALLGLLRRLAHVSSEDEFNAALESLKASTIWKSNRKLQSYVEGQWLNVKEMWASCFRSELTVRTNNGTEAQNKMLKEHYLKCHSGRKSLTGLLQTMKTFLSDREMHFSRDNLRFSSDYRVYHSSVPTFLHNRPPAVVKHIMARLHAAEDIDADHITKDEPSGIFHVQSAALADASYLVQFSTPSCSCPDFQKTRLPCKHFCAIFLHIQDWCFDRLPASYRNGPLMSLDSLTVTDVAVATPSESCGHVAANVSEECNATDTALPDLERREKLGIGALKAKVLV